MIKIKHWYAWDDNGKIKSGKCNKKCVDLQELEIIRTFVQKKYKADVILFIYSEIK